MRIARTPRALQKTHLPNRIFLLFIISSIIIIPCTSFAGGSLPSPADPPPDPPLAGTEVWLTLDKANGTAEVNDTEGDLVIFTGIVHCESQGPSVQWVRVDLEGRAEEFNATISPSSILFTGGGGESPFTVSVNISEKTKDRLVIVIVEGRYVMIPGLSYELEPVQGSVEVHYTPSYVPGEDGDGVGGEGFYGEDNKAEGDSPWFDGIWVLGAIGVVLVVVLWIRSRRRGADNG